MDPRNRTVEALVLKSAPYREKDRLLTLLSAEAGLEKALARGAAAPQGKLRPLSQPFTRVQIDLTPPKAGLSMVAGGLPLAGYLPPGGDLRRFACAAYWTELTLHAAVPGRPAPELYAPLLAAWSLLKLDDDLARASRFFELRFLAGQGLLPELKACARCGKLPGDSQTEYVLHPEEGALLCQACAGPGPWPRLSADTAERLATLAECDFADILTVTFSPSQARQANAALRAFLEYRLEYASQVRQVARRLLE